MLVERRLVMKASPEAIWKTVSNPDSYPDFMANLERWETMSEGPAGIGSRYTVHWKVGSAPVGGVVEVVEFDEPRDLAWTSITGVTQRGRFRLRSQGDRGTCVTFRLSYQAPGGLLGVIADWLAAREVGRVLALSLRNLREIVEH
ncbi:SRPBCC family protein [Mycobacterium sp. MYCO198283]|uniref:SRPBCC family protein n=1 Tax=Mycobacterium sp. MYCO198283 TaxID=2883505 RepID=UPI001E58FDF0|nr:SRPBCC family protein [Mycobacterium sp. MYCO198283]MCG5433154.1 SRPBCC family protein [Mycobacterium sp. MYCO198283]